jgi:hypothetical protein
MGTLVFVERPDVAWAKQLGNVGMRGLASLTLRGLFWEDLTGKSLGDMKNYINSSGSREKVR